MYVEFSIIVEQNKKFKMNENHVQMKITNQKDKNK